MFRIFFRMVNYYEVSFSIDSFISIQRFNITNKEFNFSNTFMMQFNKKELHHVSLLQLFLKGLPAVPIPH